MKWWRQLALPKTSRWQRRNRELYIVDPDYRPATATCIRSDSNGCNCCRGWPIGRQPAETPSWNMKRVISGSPTLKTARNFPTILLNSPSRLTPRQTLFGKILHSTCRIRVRIGEPSELHVASLLAEQFKLEMHTDQKIMPAYALVPGKGRLKLHPSEPALLTSVADLETPLRARNMSYVSI